MEINVRFLIIDDYESMRQILRSSIMEMKYQKEIFEAENIDQAQDILLQQKKANTPIEFIISDWEMPGGTGLELLAWVRDHEDFEDLPFIMVTTVSEKNHILDALQAGANNYVIKPFSTKDLKARITSVWNKKQS